MKKVLLAFVLMISLSGMVVSEAYARRFGGGSFGRQSSNVSRMAPMQRSKPATAPGQQRQGAANQQSQQGGAMSRPGGRFGGMLGGALLGLGLGALLAGMGIHGDMAGIISMVLMFMLIGFAVRMLMRMMSRKQPQAAGAYDSPSAATPYYGVPDSGRTPSIGSGLSTPSSFSAPQDDAFNAPANTEPMTWSIPADVDVESFIRNAKSYFIRMQAAWDKADINDIHAFTTPEMFAEMKMQLVERGTEPNVTDVVALDAELLGIETVGIEYIASVRFSGRVRENQQVVQTSFDEVWNFSKPAHSKEGWLLAGIQQLS